MPLISIEEAHSDAGFFLPRKELIFAKCPAFWRYCASVQAPSRAHFYLKKTLIRLFGLGRSAFGRLRMPVLVLAVVPRVKSKPGSIAKIKNRKEER